jgi:hypothetical protein
MPLVRPRAQAWDRSQIDPVRPHAIARETVASALSERPAAAGERANAAPSASIVIGAPA